jgi:hypothetical protein
MMLLKNCSCATLDRGSHAVDHPLVAAQGNEVALIPKEIALKRHCQTALSALRL